MVGGSCSFGARVRWTCDSKCGLEPRVSVAVRTPLVVLPARCALAAAADKPDGRSIVLRSSPDPTAGNHAIASQAPAEEGLGPRVHEVRETETSTCMLADHVVPGDSLLTMPKTPAVFAG